jgi:hypothetical protein
MKSQENFCHLPHQLIVFDDGPMDDAALLLKSMLSGSVFTHFPE